MNHLTEEQLILHYYGEEGDALTTEVHLDGCGECRELFGSLQRVLNVVDSLPVPECAPEYGNQVWRRIEGRIPVKRRWLPLFQLPAFGWRWAAVSAALAALLVAAFVAGRYYPQGRAQRPTAAITSPSDTTRGERVLLVAVGDYLERSQMVLIELSNATSNGKLDISNEQERASGLVSESRLYRQTALHTGDTAVSNMLDELDRVLLDIAHGPSEVSPAELDHLRQRMESEGILFKIRVMGSKVRNQADPAANGVRQRL